MFGNIGRWLWGRPYEATNDTKRRKLKGVDLRSEDNMLLPWDRDKLVSSARDLRRNNPLAAFAIRKHLDYTATFSFQCRSNVTAFDQQVESLMAWYSRPENCDVTGRYSLQRLVRMLEGVALTDGDALFLKLATGQVQLIEGDRVRSPTEPIGTDYAGPYDPTAFVHGIRADENGKPLQYAICNRTGGISGSFAFELSAILDAEHVLHHGYFDRYDQGRGVTPLSSAMNSFKDIHEASEFALNKMKLSQLFAAAFTHAASDESPNPDSAAGDNSLEFDFASGSQLAELDPGEKLEFVESQTPSTEFQAYMQSAMMLACKAVDMPFSFYDDAHTNYSGARQALLLYESSCESKRANIIEKVLEPLTRWRLSLFVADGQLKLPAGMTVDTIPFKFIPLALPEIDPVKAAAADVINIKTGLASRQDTCRARGNDFYRVADALAQENKYLTSLGLGTDAENITVPIQELLNATDTKAA